MTIRRKTSYAAAAMIGTAALTVTLAAPALATFIGTDYGAGATALAAKQAAARQLHGDYFGCGTVTLVYDTQGSDGTWSAEVEAQCQGYN